MQPHVLPLINGKLLRPLCAGALLLVCADAAAQQTPLPVAPPKAATGVAAQVVPGFWDPRRRPDRPDMSRLGIIRFMTETDYPPFNYAGADGNPIGFNVDLARLLCEEIKASCTVQMRRFDTMLDAIASNRGDALIASIAVTPQIRAGER